VTILAEQRTYVAGRWVTGDDVVGVENPADESHVADITVTPLGEVHRAIAEARRSFDDGVWADTPARERARVLHAFIDPARAPATRWCPHWSPRPASRRASPR
jgi:acyl-CoA reductase-like NAD-dependent aldehyde dehydrogenase